MNRCVFMFDHCSLRFLRCSLLDIHSVASCLLQLACVCIRRSIGTQVRPLPATPMSAGGDSEEGSHISATPPPSTSGVTHVSDTPPRTSGVTHVSDTPPRTSDDAGALAAPTLPLQELLLLHRCTSLLMVLQGAPCGWAMALLSSLFASLQWKTGGCPVHQL